MTGMGVGLCGIADDYGWFLAARVLQGAGAALVMGSAPALVTLAVPEHARNRALGFYQMGTAAGMAIGPALGGILLEWTTWRSVYLLRVPAAVVMLTLVAFIVPARSNDVTRTHGRRATRSSGRLAGRGRARRATAGVESSRRIRLGFPVVVGGAVVAVVLLIAWVAVERRSSNPVIDLSLLRNTPFTVANLLNVVANATMFAIWLLTPYYLVTVRGLSTIAGGLMLGIAPLATAIAAPIAGRILRTVRTSVLSTVGLTLEAAGLLAVAFTDADTPLLFVAGAFALVGVGLGLFTVPNLLFVMGSIPRERQGVAGALSQMMRMVGVVAGVAGATLWFDARRGSHVSNLAVPASDPNAFVAAYRDTFIAVAALCAVAIVVSLLRSTWEHALARVSRPDRGTPPRPGRYGGGRSPARAGGRSAPDLG